MKARAPQCIVAQGLVVRGLPTVAAADAAEGARAIARLLPAAVSRAEALGLAEVARILHEALQAAERLATQGPSDKARLRRDG